MLGGAARVVGDASGGGEVSWLIAGEGCIACASAPQRRSPNGHCGHGPVFYDAVGAPLSPTNETKRFQRVTTVTGLPEIRFHALRHTATTILLAKGVYVKLVSEMLGHSTIVLTLDTCSQVIPEMDGDTAAAMDAIFTVESALAHGLHHFLCAIAVTYAIELRRASRSACFVAIRSFTRSGKCLPPTASPAITTCNHEMAPDLPPGLVHLQR
jgi:hypothetical protein